MFNKIKEFLLIAVLLLVLVVLVAIGWKIGFFMWRFKLAIGFAVLVLYFLYMVWVTR